MYKKHIICKVSKYLIHDYENTQGNRLVDFRRHLNLFN